MVRLRSSFAIALIAAAAASADSTSVSGIPESSSKTRRSACLLACSLLVIAAPQVEAQLQFSAPVSYAVGTAPLWPVAHGDFNNDGKQDIVVLNRGSRTVSVLLGKGNGTFGAAHTFAAGNTPGFLAIGDFNGDGKADLAVANGAAGTVSVFLGNGDGTFRAPMHYPTGISADYVAVADFNNDKKSDLLIAASPVGPLYQGSISVLLGDGHGAFLTPKVTSTSHDATPFVAIGDFNGDGKLDVATGTANVTPYTTKGTILVFPGKGDGTFTSPVTSALNFAPGYLTSGDVNRDGRLDLAVVAQVYAVNPLNQLCASEKVVVLLGSGHGTFSVSASTPLPSAPCKFPAPRNPYAPNVVLADLNGDGKLDLIFGVGVPNPSVVGGLKPALWALPGTGDGTFQGVQKFALPDNLNWLSVGSLNSDALPDLAVGNSAMNDISVFLNLSKP